MVLSPYSIGFLFQLCSAAKRTVQGERRTLADGVPNDPAAAGAFKETRAADHPVRTLDHQVAADWRVVVNGQRAAAGETQRERAGDFAAAVFGTNHVVKRE